MKKFICLIILSVLFRVGHAQISGVKTIPGDYPNIRSAITALNASGVGSGGVTFNVAAGYTETFTSLTAGLITATGTTSNPIIFQKSGSGPNPVITAATPGTGTTDYVICLAGSDYVTFDGINIVENSLNTTATQMMERGFALLKNSGSDGCQYVTIKNCTIRLKGTNTSSYGIYSDNATPAAPGTQLTVTADAGTNSNIKIQNDSITHCGNGIFFAGCSGYFDQNNRIGADGANVLTDLGTTTGAIYGINVKYQNNLTVSQNTMNGTVGTRYFGIYTGPGDNASFEISNNTVSVYNVADTASMFGIYNTMGSNGTNNTVSISYNNISGNILPNNTSGTFTGIDNESKCFHLNCSYNNINDNIIGASSSRSQGTFNGIYNTATTNAGSSTWDFAHNTISGNTRPVGSVYGGSNNYVFCNGGALTTNFYSNVINNNSSNTVANSYLLYYVNAGSTLNMYSNQLTNFTSLGGTVFGAYLGAHFTGNIHDNIIENIVSTGPYSWGYTPSVHGLFVGTSITLENIYNNIIGDLNAPQGNFAYCVNALQLFSAYRLYNNTLFLNGVGTAENYGAYLIDDESLAGSLDMRNNILINTCTPLGNVGASYILYRGGSGNINDFAATTNNNNLYMGEWSPKKYFLAGGSFANTIQDYKAIMYPRETASFSENTPFINTSSHPYNLHINTAVATQCESGAQVISTPFPVNQDIDGEVRYPNSGYPNNYLHPASAPDAGADEFGGINVDLVPPVISCTPLPNTFVTNPRTLTAIITDVSGVPVSGNGLPVVYWKKNTTGSWGMVSGIPGGNNQYSFTFGGGVTLGDSIFYYIAAQDNAPAHNVSAFPGYGSGTFSYNPPYSQVPIPPMMYRIWNSDSISGIIPVGVGQTYTTLTDALNFISTKVFVGPVILELHDTVYPSETIPITINPSEGMSATNTLTIRPYTGVVTHISGYNVSGILNINGAKYVTIDGSNCNGKDRSLLLENTSDVWNSYTLGFKNNNGTGVSNCVIKNCKIKGNSQVSNVTMCISFDFDGGTGFNDNVLDNNQIYSAKFGIWLRSGKRNQITNNTIGSTNRAYAITYRGICIMNVDSTLISHNDIFNDSIGNTNDGQCGIYLFFGSTHTRILSNRIHDLVITSGSYNNYGIYYASDATTVTEISNNLIYNIVSRKQPYGIWIGTGGNIHLYHNTFYLSGNYMSGTSTTYSACVNINNNSITQLDFQDNIFKNSAQPITPNTNITSYAIYNNGASSVFSNLDHNDYYIDGPNPTIGYQGGAQQTLAQWQTATSRDLSSLVMDPVFNSPTGLVPTKDSLNNKGYYLTTVPKDFNDSLRSNPPDQGALNFGVDPYVVTESATNVLYNSAILNGMVNAHGVNTTITFDYGTTSAYGSTINATPNTLNTMANTPVIANLGGLSYMTTYHFRAHGVTPDGVNFYGRDFTFTTPAAPPVVVTLPATNVTGTSVMLHGTANASGSTTSVVFEYGPSTSYGSTISSVPASIFDTVTNSEVVTLTGILPNATYHYRIRGVNAGGTSYGTDMTFNTPAILPVVVTNLPTSIGSDFAQLNGTVMANNALTDVFFQYGLTTAYGTTIAASPAALSGMTPTPEAANLSSLLTNTTYHYRCGGTSIAGTAYGQDQVFTTNCIPPVISISGPVSACTGVSGYIYTTQTGNSNYEWNISAGGTITSGLGTSSITVTWNSAGPQTVSVNYSNQFNCSLSIPVVYNVTVFSNPTPTVTGPSTSCQYSTTNTYSTEAGMSNYVWTLSQGGTITSGPGTSSIVVTWNNPGAQTVSVNYNNASGCNASTPTTLNVTVDTLPAPTISGPSDICANSGYITYTTETGMTSYLWTISAGGTIVSGQGTPAVQVSWNQSGSQTISVNYANSFGCSAMSPTVYTVTVNAAPGAAGTITGITTVCGGTTGVAYSCAPITNAAYYVWTLPAGATIATGAGTDAITVDYAANASSGDITVYGNNLCGNGTTSPALTVTVTSLPGTPGNITGPANVCQGESGIVYSVEPITGATTYTWTVPTGAAIVSGNNTHSITVDFSAAASTGAITVFAGNSCGNGPVSSMTVTVNPIPAAPVITLLGTALHSDVANGNQWYLDGTLIAGATSQDYSPVATGTYWDVVTTNNCQSDTSNHIYYTILGINDQHSTGFSIYPVPNDGSFTVSIFSPSLQSFTLSIYSNIGVEVYQSGPFDVNGTVLKPIDLGPASSGLYTVIVYTADNKIVKKFLVNK